MQTLLERYGGLYRTLMHQRYQQNQCNPHPATPTRGTPGLLYRMGFDGAADDARGSEPWADSRRREKRLLYHSMQKR